MSRLWGLQGTDQRNSVAAKYWSILHAVHMVAIQERLNALIAKGLKWQSKVSWNQVPTRAVFVSAPFARNKGKQVKSSGRVSRRLSPNTQQNQPVHNTFCSLFSGGNWDFDRIYKEKKGEIIKFKSTFTLNLHILKISTFKIRYMCYLPKKHHGNNLPNHC